MSPISFGYLADVRELLSHAFDAASALCNAGRHQQSRVGNRRRYKVDEARVSFGPPC
jgi:hypothetical protein